MRQRLVIFITVAVVLVLLVALNTASYIGVEREQETEFNPDRSSYNAGPTGTRALFDLLAESGRKVVRWREKPPVLLGTGDGEGFSPNTFVVIGKPRVPFDNDEARALLRWVERGGRLVLIDRRPDQRLLPASGGWLVSAKTQELPAVGARSNYPEEMTAGVARVRASLPSALTRDVDSILPSRFAGTLSVVKTSPTPQPAPTPVAATGGEEEENGYEEEDELPPPPAPLPSGQAGSGSAYSNPSLHSPAPVAHLEDYRGPLLVDYPHGAGRIIVLADPYIVANGGLRLADNLRLAVNTVAGTDGLIAFDEYHQGRGATRNQLIAYFSGTPVMWMLAQAALVVLVVLWTRGRRFARPLPVARVDRRSSLEFVASMAELQQRARAYDLAVENIYARLRRVLVRYAGLGHNSTRSEIAARVAERSGKLNATRLETLMRECEDAINGAAVDAPKALELVRQLRHVERALGLGTRSRDARQAAEGLQRTTI